jgi:acetate---CoA ligase (ADP-forming)
MTQSPDHITGPAGTARQTPDNTARQTPASRPATPSLAISRIVRPSSIAIIGASARADSISRTVLDNLTGNGYAGAVHLVGRKPGEMAGRPILGSVAELPDELDLAVLALPAAAVPAALAELAGRAAGAVCFASGFAETGAAGRSAQTQLGETARTTGPRLLGPNCLGFFNYVDGVHVKMAPMARQRPMPRDRGPAVAVAAQSGSLAAHVVGSLGERGVPVAYSVTTGNEADLGLADCLEFFSQQPLVGSIALYAEQIRHPRRFLAAVAAAWDAGQTVTILHPGRSAASRAATQSHTGALSGDHALISTVLAGAGVAVAQTLEELIDLTELLRRFPEPGPGGLVSINGSGAVGALVQDYCDQLGLPLSELSADTQEALAGQLPEYLSVHNPLDLGTGLAVDPGVVPAAVGAAVADPGTGSVLLTLPYLKQETLRSVLEGYIAETGPKDGRVPAIFSVAEEDRPLWPDTAELARRSGVVVNRSPERAVRSLARLGEAGRVARRRRRRPQAASVPLGPNTGPLPEWHAKQLLRSVGIAVPEGALVTDADQAVKIAGRLGYPVAVKAQAAALTHKSDLNAVALGLADAGAVRSAYDQVTGTVAALPGIRLDGALVEEMASPGVELVIGARRDPQWGPVLLVGLGGIWIETLRDVRLLPPDLEPADIAGELTRLQGAALLTGTRGSAAVDLAAVATLAARVADLMLANPRISEVDLNPVIARPDGATAVDALIVTGVTGETTDD